VTVSILLVDDDPAFLDVLARALRAAGHAVDTAPNGEQALRFLAAEVSDILITDIIMPNGDGIELIRAVKRDYPTVRILAISGRGRMRSLDVLDLATQLGADAILTKPLSAEEVLAKLAEITAGR
jgi:CheY-like chemotaxis protein